MHQIQVRGGGAGTLQHLAHVVLDGLHIVIGPRLDAFDGIGGIRRRLPGEPDGRGPHVPGQLRPGQHRRGLRQVQQPMGLDAYAFADQSGLGQQLPQGLGGAPIAAIKG